jgi:hypothetical protein
MMTSLTSFHLFPKFPKELRTLIWQMAMPHQRIVSVYEISEEGSDTESEGTDPENDDLEYPISRFYHQQPVAWSAWNLENSSPYDRDDHPSLERGIRSVGFFSSSGQTQLETYGFSSPQPAPALPSDRQIMFAFRHEWETTRQGYFANDSKLPVLLYVCRESRSLYKLAFSTRTAPAGTWFNFQHDVLYLSDNSYLTSQTIDHGHWNIGQFMRHDLHRVERLALTLDRDKYHYFGPLPFALHYAVQLLGNLKDLLVVDRYDTHYEDVEELVAVDTRVEELWGHFPNWEPRETSVGRHQFFREFSHKSRNTAESLIDAAFDVERQLRTHEPAVKIEDGGKKTWRTPKVRFVMMTTHLKAERMHESRKKFREFIDDMYRSRFRDIRRGHRAPMSSSCCPCFPVHPPATSEWLQQARDVLNSSDWPSPYTKEWIETSEAMTDMDAWPWHGEPPEDWYLP